MTRAHNNTVMKEATARGEMFVLAVVWEVKISKRVQAFTASEYKLKNLISNS